MSEPRTAAGRSLLAECEDMDWPTLPDAILAIEDEARADPCPHCVVTHEWPCPTIPRCDEPGCEQEATCGWPSDAGYRRTCGDHYRAFLAAIEGSKP